MTASPSSLSYAGPNLLDVGHLAFKGKATDMLGRQNLGIDFENWRVKFMNVRNAKSTNVDGFNID